MAARHVETERRRLALVARQVRIALESRRALDRGRPYGLMGVLQDIGAASERLEPAFACLHLWKQLPEDLPCASGPASSPPIRTHLEHP